MLNYTYSQDPYISPIKKKKDDDVLYKYIVTWLCIISLLFITGCSDTPSNALKLAEKGVTASAISHNAKYVAVASANHDTAIWDLNCC